MKKIPMFLYHVTATHNTTGKIMRFDIKASCAREAVRRVHVYVNYWTFGKWARDDYTAHMEWEVLP